MLPRIVIKSGSIWSILFRGAIAVFFWAFLISQIVDPSSLERIGIDPKTHSRWRPSGSDLVIGYISLSAGAALSSYITLIGIREFKRKARKTVR